MATIIEKYDIIMAIKDNGIYPSQEVYLDRAYQMFNYDWIKTKFSKSFSDYKKVFNLNFYKAENNDCDNFQCHARSLAYTLHTNFSKSKAGVAFGEFYYEQDIGGGHAINFFIHKPVSSLASYKMDFFEPQTEKIIQLSRSERESCLALII